MRGQDARKCIPDLTARTEPRPYRWTDAGRDRGGGNKKTAARVGRPFAPGWGDQASSEKNLMVRTIWEV